jgi:hypothetical protein
LILLAFLLPFSIYLLLLGTINRRPHPVVVSGTWDFAGILFAASGFLVAIGPAIISSGSEGWRMFWLFGARAGIPPIDDSASRFWSFLAGVYFLVVVVGSAFLLRWRRGQTAIYNVRSDVLEKSLSRVFSSLGINPLRSGSLFVFGTTSPFSAPKRTAAAIQAPHHLPVSSSQASKEEETLMERDLVTDAAVLEVDSFDLLRHVTLRWEPATTLVRHEVEAELVRTLAQSTTTENPVGDWMVLIALGLIAFNLLMTFGLALFNFLHR